MIYRIIVSIIFLLLIGCGFHLRQPITAHENLPAIQIISELKNPPQLVMVRQYLTHTGFRVKETNALITLKLLAMQLDKRTYTYTSLTKAGEYQLIQTLNYQLLDSHDKALSPIIKIYQDRVYPVDLKNLSGNNQEEALIREELQAGALEQLAEQLNQSLKYIAQPANAS